MEMYGCDHCGKHRPLASTSYGCFCRCCLGNLISEFVGARELLENLEYEEKQEVKSK